MAPVNERSVPLSLAAMERRIYHGTHRFLVRQAFLTEKLDQLYDFRLRFTNQIWIVDLEPIDVRRSGSPAAHLLTMGPQAALKLLEFELDAPGPEATHHCVLRSGHLCDRAHHEDDLVLMFCRHRRQLHGDA